MKIVVGLLYALGMVAFLLFCFGLYTIIWMLGPIAWTMATLATVAGIVGYLLRFFRD